MSLKKPKTNEAIAKYKASALETIKFNLKPLALTALEAAGVILLGKLIKKLQEQIDNLNEDEARSYVKNNRDLQKLNGAISRDMDESYLNDIIVSCGKNESSKEAEDIISSLGDKELNGEDYIKMAQSSGDFDKKTNNMSKSSDLSNAINKISEITPYAIMAYVLVLDVKEWLSKDVTPSPNRSKFLQRFIRRFAGIIKDKIKNEKEIVNKDIKKTNNKISSVEQKGDIAKKTKKLNDILDSFSVLDAIITGAMIASIIYLRNRKTLQNDSMRVIEEISIEQLCFPVNPDPPLPVVPERDYKEDLTSCPIIIEEVVVPVSVYEESTNISCEPTQTQEQEPPEPKPDIATKAIYENKSSTAMKILVKVGDIIDLSSPIAILDGEKIYPSVNGIVEKVESTRIYIRDISDSELTYMQELINRLNLAYKNLNDSKLFLSEYYIPSLYPILLKNSPMTKGYLTPVELLTLKSGGIKSIWEKTQEDYKKQKDYWDKVNQKLTGKDNAKLKADAEKLEDIENELSKNEESLFNSMFADGEKGINLSKITKAGESEYSLIDYYLWLSQKIKSNFEETDLTKKLLKQINSYLNDRYFNDKYDLSSIKNKINSLGQDLAGTTIQIGGITVQTGSANYYSILLTKWKSSSMKIGQRFKAGEDYLKSLYKKQTVENEEIVERILFLFDFSMGIQELEAAKYVPSYRTKYQETELEGNWIESFFDDLIKRYRDLPNEISNILILMNQTSDRFNSYSIITIEEEQYRLYSINDEGCKPEEEESDLSPRTKKHLLKDLSYWQRYCAFATLASIANPATSWSTGLPPPVGPISFPTIYIPKKVLAKEWGFMVIGITITGIFVFPFILIGNLSINFEVPLGDPSGPIKKEISALKKELTNLIMAFKKDRLKIAMENAKRERGEAKTNIEEIKAKKIDLRAKKPKRNRKVKPESKDKARYTSELGKWEIKKASLEKDLLLAEKDRIKAETKYKIIKEAYDGRPLNKSNETEIEQLKKVEDNINSKFVGIDAMADSLDKFLAALPNSIEPMTAAFSFTIKNPKPIIVIGKNLDQVIDYPALDTFLKKFEPKNKDLMSTRYKSLLSLTSNNRKLFMDTLKGLMPLIIKIEPFPKYERLKATNLAWMVFLFTAFAPTGSTCYGFPGFPPMPMG